MARVRIRLARSSDCRALAEMRYRFRTETGLPTETKSRFLRRCTSWMRKRFRSDSYPWRCWVVDDGKQLLGHVCVQLFEKMPNPVNEPEAHAYLTNFYVVPEMRGPGTGQKIVEQSAVVVPTRRDRTQSFCGRPLKADRFIAGAAWLNLPIFWSYDIALVGRTEFDLVFVALYTRREA